MSSSKKSVSSSKKGKKIVGGSEKLVNLPEAVLGHILSLLPTEEAVRTSVLSSQWRHKWLLITRICFDDDKVCAAPKKKAIGKKNLFVKFVERVLLLLGNSVIQEFRLRCSFEGYRLEQISKWILVAMRHDARRIDICCPEVGSLAFPCLTYCGDHLEELKLDMDCRIKVGSAVSFSSLKIMDLNDVQFVSSNVGSESADFNFSFDVLEVLKLGNCRWKCCSVMSIVIRAPRLTSFTIKDNSGKIKCCTCECLLVMDVPKLTKFECCGYSVPSIYLMSTSAVVDLSLLPSEVSNWERVREGCAEILQILSTAKILKVSSKLIKNDIPRLENLVELVVTDGKFDESFMALLRCAPLLESLTFGKFFEHNKNEDVRGMISESVMSRLKVVQFHGTYGRNGCWLELAKFLLKNAMILEKMVIESNSRHCLSTNETEQLLVCPRCSSSASIVFSKYTTNEEEEEDDYIG